MYSYHLLQMQNQSEYKGISAFSRIETRQQKTQRILQEKQENEVARIDISSKSSSFTFTNYFLPVARTVSPLPELGWADPKEVWSVMLEKDRIYTKDPLMLRKHPQLQPRMRAVLLDWIIEVSKEQLLIFLPNNNNNIN